MTNYCHLRLQKQYLGVYRVGFSKINEERTTKKEKSDIKWYACGKTGHYANECTTGDRKEGGHKPALETISTEVTFNNGCIIGNFIFDLLE